MRQDRVECLGGARMQSARAQHFCRALVRNTSAELVRNRMCRATRAGLAGWCALWGGGGLMG